MDLRAHGEGLVWRRLTARRCRASIAAAHQFRGEAFTVLRGLFREVGTDLVDTLTWGVLTRLPLVERAVRPVPRRPGWVRIAVRGTTFTVPDHRWWKVFVKQWEADTFRAYRAFVRPGDTVVDVGAWIGPTIMFATACGARRILAIEPNPACRPYLEALKQSIPPDKTELLISTTGVFSVAGNAEFGIPGGAELAARASASLFGRGTQIEVDTLPGLLAKHGITDPALVKIDIEGAEFAIPDQIATFSRMPGIRIFLSLHPPFAPGDSYKDDMMAALEGFDIYDAHLEPVTRETLSARLHSNDPKPSWGTVFGNFFEVALAPRGEPLRRVRKS